jgi:hypothetical protein
MYYAFACNTAVSLAAILALVRVIDVLVPEEGTGTACHAVKARIKPSYYITVTSYSLSAIVYIYI